MMTASPAARATTSPLADTVATVVSELVHLTAPVTGCPFALPIESFIDTLLPMGSVA
ncbi:MAG TPA: hypothetical protein VFJ96_10125 [Gemmatimonadaceae bacterium]|nr:hypothetical protein [Gemmatimonadaceae bacterium]